MKKLPALDLKFLSEAAASEEELDSFIARRLKGEPVAKIIGKKGFWKDDFVVSYDVLDPRPDSETLIEAVLQTYPDKEAPLRFLDLGTGSGCLLLSLLGEYPNATGVGVEISEKALKIANQNNKLKRAKFILGDMKKTLADLGQFDILISNPPYIPTKDIESLEPDTKDYDPMLALDGGTDGLDFYRALSKQHLAPTLFIEIGINQENEIIPLFESEGWHFVRSWKDLGGIIRILSFKA